MKRQNNILVWLPSPMGDAILCTPAMRAIRERFHDSRITFLTTATVRSILSPCDYNDEWIALEGGSLGLAKKLRHGGFDTAILFKNSFGSALTVFLAGISERVGYSRDVRGLFLTRRLMPARDAQGKYRPGSMIDYYLDLCAAVGCETENRDMELQTDAADEAVMLEKLPAVADAKGPLVVLVPGGAFGPSKCWPAERYAALADRLCDEHNATVAISVAPSEAERKIANEITDMAASRLVSLADVSLSLGELKSLISRAELLVTNDTGPRHIAIALKRKVITLFGPNNPQWTQTGYAGEVQIVGEAECVPCDKPVCKEQTHVCMESITVDRVYDAANELLS